MKTINLKDYYDHIGIDTYIDIPDEVFNIFEECRKGEQAYQSRIRYHKAYYSLDHDDGIEHSALFVSLSPDEAYERKLTSEQLHAAIATLPDKQAKRIYAHYFLGMSKTAIAKAEGVSETAVRIGIEKALINLEKIFKKSFQGFRLTVFFLKVYERKYFLSYTKQHNCSLTTEYTIF